MAMESSSTKVIEILSTEKKLKQATLPFEIVKISSKSGTPLLKRQKLNSFSNIEEDDSVVVIEDVEVNVRKQSSPTEDSFQMEVEENTSETGNQDSKYKIDDNGMGENSSDVIVIEDSEVCNSESVSKPVSEVRNDNEDDHTKSSKRKLESAEKMKELKPPKRAKLIYNIDKINTNQGVSNTNFVNISYGVSRTEQKTSIYSDKHIVGKNLETINSKFSNIEIDLESKNALSFSEQDKNGSDQVFIGESVGNQQNMCYREMGSPNGKNENRSPSGKNTTKQLTPKQIERKAEKAKRREEIQQERDRRKLEKDRMKQEKEEEKVRLKQEKEEVKKRKKEEKEKKRLEEIELKNEEKRKKEEERRKKEEEKLEEKRKKEEQKLEDKRKKEEMLKKKEEEHEKKKFTKEAQAFSSFFKKRDSKSAIAREGDGPTNKVFFMPFAVRADMRLAPVNRNPMDDDRISKFDELYSIQSTEILYLEELRSGLITSKKSDNTWPLEEKYEEVVCLDEGLDLNDEVAAGPTRKFNNRKPKLLQFYENRRPPYWGTWRKKSKNIKPKVPFGKDEIFDYEVDSDDEWEEEEPGESLHGSDDEKESEDEYEVDNDFFVPHGYLSDDENPEEETISPETQKAKLKLLGEQFDLERNEKTKLLKPILLGCIWFKSNSDQPASAKPSVVTFLNKRKAVLWTENIPISILQDENKDPSEILLSDSGTPTSNKEIVFPESGIADLITLIHGSTNSRKNLAKTFLAQWNKKREESANENYGDLGILSQARIAKKIKELAKWEEFPEEEGSINGKFCWYVKKEVREKFGLSDLLTSQKGDDSSEVRDFDSSKKCSPSLITKFTKILTEDERRNQITNPRKSQQKQVSEFSPNISKQVTPLKCIKKLQEFWAKPSVTSKYFPSVEVYSCDSETKKDDSDRVILMVANQELKKVECDKIDNCEAMEIENTSTNLPSRENTVDKKSSKEELCPASSEEYNRLADVILNSEVKRTSESAKVPAVDSKPVLKKRVAILYSAPRGCEIVKPIVEPKERKN